MFIFWELNNSGKLGCLRFSRQWLWRMPSSGMFHCVALVRTNVLEELSTSIISSVHQLLVTANVVPSSSIFVTLMMEALSSSETLVLTRTTRRNILEDCILGCFMLVVDWLHALREREKDCLLSLSWNVSYVFLNWTIHCGWRLW
jgi:hypothetical protein